MSKMLIDARHPEETRVVVMKGNRIEEFDFESADKKQLKGNIYLAKVTRVEPSLQAAFVEYGGNRHGFLAFSEIHPDYYQIPHEDREALLREEREHHEEVDRDSDRRARGHKRRRRNGRRDEPRPAEAGSVNAGLEPDELPPVMDADAAVLPADIEAPVAEVMVADGAVDLHDDDDHHDDDHHEAEAKDADHDEDADEDDDEEDGAEGESEVTEAGAIDDAAEEVARRRRSLLRRRYKIQDVIKRRQILLIQVIKEERGGKGAALTTYLSLAGRYCVLMPNTTHGGGISRKISSTGDRKRLKEIMGEMELPKGMGCIIRTAGLKRTKSEIRRDFDYLTRLWDEIRENTLHSVAPAMIYEDSSLIKRAIRDIYNKDIEEVIIDGQESYRTAKEFMRLLMPSHARRVQQYQDRTPLFQRLQAESQLETMYHPVVQLKSGGYIVINPTEALVSIDINSGRSTREHNIEETAVKTNCEAADEIARQLRLRDMAGLVVIDFIDMEDNKNVRTVERRLKEALKNDRARIQVGRISQFGLMEMSRQRLRTGVLEASTHECSMCKGAGFVRSISSSALFALRGLEEDASKLRAAQINLRVPAEVAIYILNNKRSEVAEIEDRCGIKVDVLPKEGLQVPEYELDRLGTGPLRPIKPMEPPIILVEDEPDYPEDEEEDDEPIISGDVDGEDEDDKSDAKPRARGRDGGNRDVEGDRDKSRGRNRRRRRGGRDREDREPREEREPGAVEAEKAGDGAMAAPEAAGEAPLVDGVAADDAVGSDGRARRRRGRRGGKRRREPGEDDAPNDGDAVIDADAETVAAVAVPLFSAEPLIEVSAPQAPVAKARAAKILVPDAPVPNVPITAALMPETVTSVVAPSVSDIVPEGVVVDASVGGDSDAAGTSRKGWWQRTFG
jgi:ribonuclease E